jgi:hypothetical protein
MTTGSLPFRTAMKVVELVDRSKVTKTPSWRKEVAWVDGSDLATLETFQKDT